MSIIPKSLRVIDDPIVIPRLKLKGRRLYLGDQEVAEIRGYREWFKGEPSGEYQVCRNGEVVASGFCYFADAVKWARDVIGRGE